MNTLNSLNCPKCSSNKIYKDRLTKTGQPRYICFDCKKKFLSEIAFQTSCLNCGTTTSNPRFCSRSCAVSYNNKTIHLKHGRYVGKKYCRKCNGRMDVRSNSHLCRKCFLEIPKTEFYRNFLTKTIGDVLFEMKLFRETTEVRWIARELWQRLNYPQHCEVCGYNKHYEICHIEAIKDFSLETKLKVVNNPSNLVALCPNCHWEFDHQVMDEECLNKLQFVASNRKKRYLDIQTRV
jgi:hypothetical protein